MNRRGFLRLLSGAAAMASTNPVHFLAPPQGWHPMQSGLFIANAQPSIRWRHLTASDIMVDFEDMLRVISIETQIPLRMLKGAPISKEQENDAHLYYATVQKGLFSGQR